jgi:hypothetical protein
MLHDTDLIDRLVTLIGSAEWSSTTVSSVKRVWNGQIAEEEIAAGSIAVQLWPDQQRHRRITRAGIWSLEVDVGIVFWSRMVNATLAEIDLAMHAYDGLLIGPAIGLGSELLDVVEVTVNDEVATFCREGEIGWPVRPNLERLQRLKPVAGVEKYTGLLQAQALLSYTRH